MTPSPSQPQHAPDTVAPPTGEELRGRVVALFAGQGSQYLGMGRELYQRFPSVREAFEQIDRLFAAEGKPTVSQTVYPEPSTDQQAQAAQAEALQRTSVEPTADAKAIAQQQAEALQRTDYAQPAIGALSVGLYRLLRQLGFQPDFAAGHSFGELTALWAAGALADADYFSLVKARGAAMASGRAGDGESGRGGEGGNDPGTMLAVRGSAEQVRPVIAQVEGYIVANVNAPLQVVVAGPRAGMAEARQALKAAGLSSTPLPVSAAFHTALVGHAQQPFARAIRAVRFHSPGLRVYANATAQPYPAEPEAVQAVLAEHLVSPVLFLDEIEAIYRDGGRLFVEFGPRNILTKLVRDILGDRPHFAVALNPGRGDDSLHQLQEALAQLRAFGLSLRDLDG